MKESVYDLRGLVWGHSDNYYSLSQVLAICSNINSFIMIEKVFGNWKFFKYSPSQSTLKFAHSLATNRIQILQESIVLQWQLHRQTYLQQIYIFQPPIDPIRTYLLWYRLVPARKDCISSVVLTVPHKKQHRRCRSSTISDIPNQVAYLKCFVKICVMKGSKSAKWALTKLHMMQLSNYLLHLIHLSFSWFCIFLNLKRFTVLEYETEAPLAWLQTTASNATFKHTDLSSNWRRQDVLVP